MSVFIGGTSSADSEFNATYDASKGFDNNAGTRWSSSLSVYPHWLKYDLGSVVTKIVGQITVNPFYDGGVGGSAVKDFKFQGSNNDSDWDDLYTATAVNSSGEKVYSFANSTAYRYYRIYVTTTYRSDNYCSIVELEGVETVVPLDDNLNISDSITVTDTTNIASNIEVLQVSDSIALFNTNTDAKYANKIISINPLVFVTDSTPPEIVKVDTSNPSSLTWEVKTISGITTAYDVTVDSSDSYVYVAGNTGKIVKIEIANLSNQTTIDVSDTDDLTTIESNVNFGLIYAGTDNAVGELYMLDERDTFNVDSDFQALSEKRVQLETDFRIVDAFTLDSNFNALSYTLYAIGSDFKCLTEQLTPITSVDDITPINLEDFHVFVDSVELTDTDLILNSISITHSVGEESRASFRLSRKHDQLNTTLNGVSSVITNQNNVEIKIKDTTEFIGKISELDCQYQDNEFVNISALSDEKENKTNKITMSLPGLTSRLSLYDILIQNPRIFNPYIDPDNEETPKKYKGIKTNLGVKTTQSLAYYRFDDNGTRNLGLIAGTTTLTPGAIATQIESGSFNPKQNWTYFWGADVYKTVSFEISSSDSGNAQGYIFPYIGTSLAPVSEDLWVLVNANYYRQRVFEDNVTGKISLASASPGYTETTKLDTFRTETVITGYNPFTYEKITTWDYETYYYVGEAPFKEISPRNGQFIAKPKLTDRPSTLAFVTDEGYNFTNYAKTVADLEYEKLKNINGDILPDTSCTFTLTTDAYLYYQISLLTQINIDNTTQSDIYKNANGFPVSAKSITITSSDRKVSIDADNSKSAKELEIINSQFPDEDDDEYNQSEYIQNIFGKGDMRTKLGAVEPVEPEEEE